MSIDEIRELLLSVGGVAGALVKAEPGEKAVLYRALGLWLAYHPSEAMVRVEANLDPHVLGLKVVSGGGLEPPRPVKGTSTSS